MENKELVYESFQELIYTIDVLSRSVDALTRATGQEKAIEVIVNKITKLVKRIK